MEIVSEEQIGKDRLDSRWERGRRQWEEVRNRPAVAGRHWRMMSFLELVVILCCVYWIGYLGKMPKQIPYVLDRDKAGNISYAGAIQPVDMDATTWNLVKIQALRQFLESWRTVTMDRTAQGNDWDRAFLYIGEGSQAMRSISTWYEQNDPIQRLNKGELVSVQYKTFDVEGEHTFGVWWEETTTSLNGQITSKKLWRARVVYIMHIPSSEVAREQNSLGLLITELSWEQVQ